MVKAVLMAGGKGSRIRPLTLSRPKPMIPIANRPLIEYIVEKITKSGYKEIVITLSYLNDQIKYLLKKDYPSLNIKYSIEEKPLGTAGGVKNASKYLDDAFFVLSGDVLADVDLNKLLAFHEEKEALATIVLTPVSKPEHYGIAQLDHEQRIIKFLEKPSSAEIFSKLANTGTYVLEPEIFDYIKNKKGEVDFSKDVFPQLIKKKKGIYGFVFNGYWNDVGRPITFLQANYDVLNQRLSIEPVGKKLNESVGRLGNIWVGEDVEIHRKSRLIGPVLIGDGCEIEERAIIGKNTVLGENVVVEKNSTIKESVIFQDSIIKNNAYLRECIVDTECHIEKGAFIEKGAILGSSVHLGSHSRIRSERSIYNSNVILPKSIVDSDYPIVT